MIKCQRIWFSDDGFSEISEIDPEEIFVRRDGVEIRCCDVGVEIIDRGGLLSYAIGGGEHGGSI